MSVLVKLTHCVLAGLDDSYAAIFEADPTPACLTYENSMCTAINDDCTSCAGCTDEAEAYYAKTLLSAAGESAIRQLAKTNSTQAELPVDSSRPPT